MADSLADMLKKDNIEFQNATLSFNIAPGTTLAKPEKLDSIQSPNGTLVTLVLEQEAIECSFNPPLKLVTTQWYADNAFWDSVRFTFPKFQKPGVDPLVLSVRDDGGNLCDPSSKIIPGIADAFKDMMAGTRLVAAGFSPLDDPDPQGALKDLEKKFAGSAVSTSAKFPTSQINLFTMSVTIRLTQTIAKVDPKVGGLVIAPNKPITVRATFPQTGDVIQKWFEDKSAPLPELNSVTVSSPDAFTVQRRLGDGTLEDSVLLQDVRITRGPMVTVPKLRLLKGLKDASDTVWALGFMALFALNAAEFSHAGAPGDYAAALALEKTKQQDPSAELIPGISRRMMEEVLTTQVKSALEQFFADYFDVITAAIPNYSQVRIFGMPLNRCE